MSDWTLAAGIRKVFHLVVRSRARVRAEADAELATFLEERIDDLVRRGLTPGAARAVALQRLGGPLGDVRAELRESAERRERSLTLQDRVDGLLRDVGSGLRALRKSPGFTTVAVITLALGVGSTTTIFSLMQQVMLRSLPVRQPSRLWRVGDATSCCYSDGYSQGDRNGLPQNDWSLFSWEAYRLFRAGTPAFEQLAAFQIGEANAHLSVRRAGSIGPGATANGEYVSGNFFETFRIDAWRGRLFTDADDRDGAPPVAVMSFHAWQGMYGSDPSVVGTTYDLNGHPFTVVGVAWPGFFGAKVADSDMPDFWLPLTTEPVIAGATSRLRNPRLAWLDLIGRVRPGTNPRALETQLQVELNQWLASHVPDMTAQETALWEKQTLRLTSGSAGVSLMRRTYTDALWLLFMASACVLLVACANIANLLLARGLKDRHQTAVRAALGASRARLVRKALAESLVLSVFGAAVGIAVAYAGARLILHLAIAGPDTWVPLEATPSAPVLLFALGISVITGVVFGVVPAWTATLAYPVDVLRGANRGEGGSRSSWGTGAAQRTLVIVQATVSVVLLSAAAMLGQSLRNLEHRNLGFATEGRYLVTIDPRISGYGQEQLVPRFREIEGHLQAIPGVRMVGSVLEAPLNGWVWPHDIRVEGKTEEEASSGWTRVTPGFFETLGAKVVMGRSITSEDNGETRPIAVVNETFAKRFLGGESPIGQHFGPVPAKNAGMYEIVGVVSDMDFGNGLVPMYFLPEAQSTRFDDPESEEREVSSHYLYNALIWAPGQPSGLQTQIKAALAAVDPTLVVYGVRSYADVIHSGFAQQNMIASLTSLFGAVALVLAAVGLYGVMAYGVEQRTREIGVRMALGTNRSSVVAMVLRQAFAHVGVGLALGIPAAVGAGHLIANQLYGVRPWDPLTLFAATLLLGLATLVAAFIPARRATSIDPILALRSD